ncbi:helix-turn-helix domain-containing protein [Sporobacter termitidis]|uniref:helix-turn-helix domain-containing protein n=1 Tax=Sporobacter termitidis TaxID=44749 RepID=UPI000933511D
MNEPNCIRGTNRLNEDQKQPAKLTYTVDEAAEILGLSRPVMYSLCHSPDCKFSIRIGKRILISKVALEAWLSEQAAAQM